MAVHSFLPHVRLINEGQSDVLLYGSSVRPWVCLHGEVNSQCCLVDVGDDRVCCRDHLRKALGALLNGREKTRRRREKRSTRQEENPPPSVLLFSDRLQSYLLQIQLVKPLHVQRKKIWVGFLQFIVDDVRIQPSQKREKA